MKIKLSYILVVSAILLHQNSNAQEQEFRNSSWGATKDEVKRDEQPLKPIAESEHILRFPGKLADLDAAITYVFNSEDQLMEGRYLLESENMDPVLSIDDYEMFQNALSKKYGSPSQKNVIVINKQNITEDEWATNLAHGNLAFDSKWSTENTDIDLTLDNNYDKIVIEISYVSKAYKEQDVEEKIAKMLDDI